MKILIWNSIWPSQGQIALAKNSFKNYLLKEANVLARLKFDVDVVIPDCFRDLLYDLDRNVKVIFFSLSESVAICPEIETYEYLYKNGTSEIIKKDILYKRLSENYDFIILWENPVPFLEARYPNALFLHQMPGIMSRAPANNFITIDTKGLFRKSILCNSANDIKKVDPDEECIEYITRRKNFFKEFNFFESVIDKNLNKELETLLLPLQVSDHYNFKVDSGYKNQLDFLINVLEDNRQSNVIVTQYVTPNIKDTVLSESNYQILKDAYKNLVYLKEFDLIPSVSELIINNCDRVVTCSSSLGIQALLLGKELKVLGDTYIKPYSGLSRECGGAIASFILGYYNIDFNYLISHPQFFINLLFELSSRKDREGIGRLCNYSYIDDDYKNTLLEPREGRARKNWKQYLIRPNNTLNSFSKCMKNDDIKVISFDIFDTLINRPLFKPSRLYDILSEKVCVLSNGAIQNFNVVRGMAESCTRELNEHKETNLNLIYDWIKKKFSIDEELINKIKDFEVQTELHFCTKNTDGIILFNKALETKKQVVLTTDMYLSKEAIVGILDKNGIRGYSKIYLSCECGVSKSYHGEIFNYIINAEGLENASQLMHIGDKKLGDYEIPAKLGVKAFRLISNVDRLKGNKKLVEAINPSLNFFRNCIFGLAHSCLLNSTSISTDSKKITGGSLTNLGYMGLGPVVLGYVLWLKSKLSGSNYSYIYFLAREGDLLKKAYDYVCPNNNTRYVLASRRALYGATIVNRSDIYNVCNLSYVEGTDIKYLLKSRFGLSDLDLLNVDNKKLSSDQASKLLLFETALSLEDRIYKISDCESKLYLEYLRNDIGLEGKIAVVDVGWQGRMQSRLQLLINKKVDGFYYALMDNVCRDISAISFVGNSISNNTISISSKYRKIFEYLLCSPNKSFICFRKKGGGVRKSLFTMKRMDIILERG